MRLVLALLAATAAMTCAAQAATLEIKDAVLHVTVVPEDRSDIKVEIVRQDSRQPLSVRTEGTRTIIDGNRHWMMGSCKGSGWGGADRMAKVVVHTPRAVSIAASGSVSGVIGRSASLDMRNSGCGEWTIADTAGDATIHHSGAGALKMGAAETLDVYMSGATSVHATQVRRGLNAQLSGTGDVEVAYLTGSLDARISGVGKVRVAQGRADNVRASVSGMGGIEFGGVARNLNASISGLGDIRVAEVTGRVTKSVSGAGSVKIGKRPS